MTVSNTTSKIRYTGNGTTTAFTFPFKIFDNTDLEVYLITTATGASVLQTITTHYTVAITENADGGTVTMVTAPASTEELLIKRVLPRTQAVDLPAVSNFPEESIENALDKLTMLTAELEEAIDRTFALGETVDDSGIDTTLPTPSANKVIGWDSAGTALENKTLTITESQYDGAITQGTDAGKAASPDVGDIHIATDTFKIYRCFVAGTWSTKKAYGNEVNHAKGADIASAATTDIGAATGNFVHVTGTVTITALGTVQAGTIRVVRFAGALILTHNATSLILPSAANITTVADDVGVFISEGSGNWRCVLYQRASGLSVVGGGTSFQVNNTSAQNNISNSGSYVDIVLDNEIFDSDAAFASNTFTAPSTGKYQLNFIVMLTNIDTASTGYFIQITTSNRNYEITLDPRQFVADIASKYPLQISVVADMDANDTAKCQFKQDGGSAQTDIEASGNAIFSGHII